MQKKVFAMVDDKLQGCLKAVKDETRPVKSGARFGAIGSVEDS